MGKHTHVFDKKSVPQGFRYGLIGEDIRKNKDEKCLDCKPGLYCLTCRKITCNVCKNNLIYCYEHHCIMLLTYKNTHLNLMHKKEQTKEELDDDTETEASNSNPLLNFAKLTEEFVQTNENKKQKIEEVKAPEVKATEVKATEVKETEVKETNNLVASSSLISWQRQKNYELERKPILLEIHERMKFIFNEAKYSGVNEAGSLKLLSLQIERCLFTMAKNFAEYEDPQTLFQRISLSLNNPTIKALLDKKELKFGNASNTRIPHPLNGSLVTILQDTINKKHRDSTAISDNIKIYFHNTLNRVFGDPKFEPSFELIRFFLPPRPEVLITFTMLDFEILMFKTSSQGINNCVKSQRNWNAFSVINLNKVQLIYEFDCFKIVEKTSSSPAQGNLVYKLKI